MVAAGTFDSGIRLHWRMEGDRLMDERISNCVCRRRSKDVKEEAHNNRAAERTADRRKTKQLPATASACGTEHLKYQTKAYAGQNVAVVCHAVHRQCPTRAGENGSSADT